MTVIDAPPGIGFAGLAVGEFTARPRRRWLAGRVLLLVLSSGAATAFLATRRAPTQAAEALLALPLVCMSVALVGYAVRRAHLRIDGDGVRWGWSEIGFRVTRDQLERIRVYADAIAVVPRRGSTWYLSGHDWARFDQMPPVLERAGLPLERMDGRAPLAARLQSYGLVLDLLLVGTMVASVGGLAVALHV